MEMVPCRSSEVHWCPAGARNGGGCLSSSPNGGGAMMTSAASAVRGEADVWEQADVAEEIFRRLPVESLRSAALVCRRWRVVAESDRVWKEKVEELRKKAGDGVVAECGPVPLLPPQSPLFSQESPPSFPQELYFTPLTPVFTCLTLEGETCPPLSPSLPPLSVQPGECPPLDPLPPPALPLPCPPNLAVTASLSLGSPSASSSPPSSPSSSWSSSWSSPLSSSLVSSLHSSPSLMSASSSPLTSALPAMPMENPTMDKSLTFVMHDNEAPATHTSTSTTESQKHGSSCAVMEAQDTVTAHTQGKPAWSTLAVEMLGQAGQSTLMQAEPQPKLRLDPDSLEMWEKGPQPPSSDVAATGLGNDECAVVAPTATSPYMTPLAAALTTMLVLPAESSDTFPSPSPCTGHHPFPMLDPSPWTSRPWHTSPLHHGPRSTWKALHTGIQELYDEWRYPLPLTCAGVAQSSCEGSGRGGDIACTTVATTATMMSEGMGWGSSPRYWRSKALPGARAQAEEWLLYELPQEPLCVVMAVEVVPARAPEAAVPQTLTIEIGCAPWDLPFRTHPLHFDTDSPSTHVFRLPPLTLAAGRFVRLTFSGTHSSSSSTSSDSSNTGSSSTSNINSRTGGGSTDGLLPGRAVSGRAVAALPLSRSRLLPRRPVPTAVGSQHYCIERIRFLGLPLEAVSDADVNASLRRFGDQQAARHGLSLASGNHS